MSSIANDIEFRCHLEQLMLLAYRICPCRVAQLLLDSCTYEQHNWYGALPFDWPKLSARKDAMNGTGTRNNVSACR